MANTSSSSTVMTLKLLINTQTQKVLFAEAGNDFVDFLFYILSLPVAKVIGLVGKQSMVGSLANLYESVENLNETYVQPNMSKSSLLKPPVGSTPSTGVPLLAINAAPAAQRRFYKCSYTPNRNSDDFFYSPHYGGQAACTINYVSDDPSATCPECNRKMTTEMPYVSPPSPKQQQVPIGEEGGFVKGVVTYMVMDNLVVKPMSTISSITMLNKFNVKEVGALEEKVVHFGMAEAVKLLKASMKTESVLTNVFLQPEDDDEVIVEV